MNCPKCKNELHLVQTVSSPAGRTLRYECENGRCGSTFVGVMLILQEINDRGTGIHAVMKKIKDGKVRVVSR